MVGGSRGYYRGDPGSIAKTGTRQTPWLRHPQLGPHDQISSVVPYSASRGFSDFPFWRVRVGRSTLDTRCGCFEERGKEEMVTGRLSIPLQGETFPRKPTPCPVFPPSERVNDYSCGLEVSLVPDARRGRNPDVFDELEFERSRARASTRPETHSRSSPKPRGSQTCTYVRYSVQPPDPGSDRQDLSFIVRYGKYMKPEPST